MHLLYGLASFQMKHYTLDYTMLRWLLHGHLLPTGLCICFGSIMNCRACLPNKQAFHCWGSNSNVLWVTCSASHKHESCTLRFHIRTKTAAAVRSRKLLLTHGMPSPSLLLYKKCYVNNAMLSLACLLMLNITRTQYSLKVFMLSRYVLNQFVSTFKHIQLWTFAYIRLLNKPYENQVTLTGQNPP